MKHLQMRRLTHFVILLLFSVAAWATYSVYSVTLVDSRFFSGWTLFGVIVALTFLNLRKKVPFLPIGSSAAWLQLHIYAGWFAVVVYVIHIGISIPNGALDIALSALLITVALSGMFGLLISRLLPIRLSNRPPAVLFEMIPTLRRQVTQQVEQLVLGSVDQDDSRIIPDIYKEKIAAFLAGPRNIAFHFFGSGTPRRTLLADLENVQRYANAGERSAIEKIAEGITEKDRLDYHYSLQLLLKGWLFVHIPLSYGLIIVALFHSWLAYLYSGSTLQ
jgi:hypothetical protein